MYGYRNGITLTQLQVPPSWIDQSQTGFCIPNPTSGSIIVCGMNGYTVGDWRRVGRSGGDMVWRCSVEHFGGLMIVLAGVHRSM